MRGAAAGLFRPAMARIRRPREKLASLVDGGYDVGL